MQRHALFAALLFAIALTACQSTAPDAASPTDTSAVGRTRPADRADRATMTPDQRDAESSTERRGQAVATPPAALKTRANAAESVPVALDSIEVSGSRLDVARDAIVEPAGALAASPPAPPAAPIVIEAYAPSPMAAAIAAPNTEHYAQRDDNPVHRSSEQPVSTFSIDVDTGSYSNVRRMLAQGTRPPADAVRAEEMINYFSYGHPAPTSLDVPFRTTVELAPAPWNAKRELLMIGIKGYDVPKTTLPPANLVFLIDTSGSMNEPNKLPLLKQAFGQLVNQLRAQDHVSIVVYAGSAGLVLPPTSGAQREDIVAALDHLNAGGSTNGGAGIQLAYAMAKQSFEPNGVNRVIMATDGDFNVGTIDQGALETFVGDQRKSGVALTTLGFGDGNYNDQMAERLADVGDGNHAYIDTLQEARKVLVDEMQSTLLTIARDVKIQIEFNPAQVAEYRLVGYENRLLKREDFSNDRVDAGDIGAGHEVTALYEITRTGSAAEQLPALRYGSNEAAQATMGDEIAHLRLRYKTPGNDVSRLIETPIRSDQLRAVPGDSMRFAATVAAYADALRGGAHLQRWTWNDIARSARQLQDSGQTAQRREFASLVDAARQLTGDLRRDATISRSDAPTTPSDGDGPTDLAVAK